MDHRADIYSLGVVFYEMLTGELPLGKFSSRRRSKVQVDVRLDEVVLRALEKEPERRYQQASEVKTDVETIAGSAAGSTAPVGEPLTAVAVPTTLSQTRLRLSRAAVLGALWTGLFFVNWITSYTSPGWELTALFRDSIGNVATGLLFSGPLFVLGFSAPLGATALGIVTLRQIRQSRRTVGGLGLASFDVLFFPLLLLNRWMFWLVSQVVSEISLTDPAAGASSTTPGWVVVAFAFVALAVNGMLIRTAWRMATKFVRSAPPPTRPPVAGNWTQVLKRTGLRLALLVIVHIALVETLQQVSLHWKESTGERLDMALMVGSLAGVVWACWPGFRLKQSPLFWAGGTIVSGGLLLGLDLLYVGYLRPNLGLYREEDWVVQNVGFQMGRRLGIAKHHWRRKLVAPNFGPTVEVLLPVDDERRCQWVDLDTGRQVARTNFVETDRKTLPWARTEMLDVVARLKEGRVSALGLGLGTAPVPDYHWEKDGPQNVADYFLLEWQQPKESSVLWPFADHWHLERHSPREWMPQWLLTNNTGTFISALARAAWASCRSPDRAAIRAA